MTLTVCVGSSGSGKTTFLNDVYKSHKCVYIRQYHSMRPYITLSKIPNFDPSELPFYEIYKREGTLATIQVGGTMAGEFTAGLSGGQRKLLLFELIYQRTINHSELLIVLDEPFAGVTDDFVPHIVKRLNALRATHNTLVVTNDHVETLTKLADNTIRVSAIDRTKVTINGRGRVDRDKAIVAMSLGDDYSYQASKADLKFFWEIEIVANEGLRAIAVLGFVCFALFIASFWDSATESASLILIAGELITYFCINPYLLALIDWRNAMIEESEALMHASVQANLTLMTILTTMIILVLTAIEYGVVNLVVEGLEDFTFWVAMFFDSAWSNFPLICLGLFTHMSSQTVHTIGYIPFLLMVFLSTTFSPGSGVPYLKELRYLFPRYFLWCMTPGVSHLMENCPNEQLNLWGLISTSLLPLFIFLAFRIWWKIRGYFAGKSEELRRASLHDKEFKQLQVMLYGKKALRQFKHMSSDTQSLDDIDSTHEPFTASELNMSLHDSSSGASFDDLNDSPWGQEGGVEQDPRLADLMKQPTLNRRKNTLRPDPPDMYSVPHGHGPGIRTGIMPTGGVMSSVRGTKRAPPFSLGIVTDSLSSLMSPLHGRKKLSSSGRDTFGSARSEAESTAARSDKETAPKRRQTRAPAAERTVEIQSGLERSINAPSEWEETSETSTVIDC